MSKEHSNMSAQTYTPGKKKAMDLQYMKEK